MRTNLAKLLVPVMKLSGFRFSKDYRWGVTPFHRAVYACLDVVSANLAADKPFRPLKLIERAITRRLKPQPCYLTGWRLRLEHFAIALGYFGKGYQLDTHTFLQRLKNKDSRYHLAAALGASHERCLKIAGIR